MHVLHDDAGHTLDLMQVRQAADLSSLVAAHFSSDSPTGLFRVSDTDPAAQQELLGGLRRHLPQRMAAAAEGPGHDGVISLEELQQALRDCHNGKAPGLDGLPYEVYKVLGEQLLPVLWGALRDIYLHGTPAEVQWAVGVIIPIFFFFSRERLQSETPHHP